MTHEQVNYIFSRVRLDEIFKDIKGFEGFYMISTYGQILNVKTLKLIKPNINRVNGYYRVGLSKNGVRKFFYLHKLVADTFIPNPYNLPQVNHKDEDKLNVYVGNLEHCDARYNRIYSRNNWQKGKNRAVHQYQDNERIAVYPSIAAASRATGATSWCIQLAARGRTNTAGGYKWKFPQAQSR